MSTFHFIVLRLLFVTILLRLTHCNDLTGIKYCQIGLGHAGLNTLQIALQKGVTLVAAFTRTSFIGLDVNYVLGLNNSIGVLVSPLENLDKILKETNPDICHDATKDDLSSIYPHLKIVLSNGINVITLASHLIYPYKPDDTKKAAELDQIAQEHNATLSVSGIQDTYFQMNVLSMISSMNYITTIDVSWIPKWNEMEYWYNKGIEATKDILEPFTIQMVKWYGNQLKWKELSLNCLNEYRETIDQYNNIDNNGNIIGIWNFTCIFEGHVNNNKNEILSIIWRNEFFFGNDDSKDVVVIKLIGDPNQQLKLADIPFAASKYIAINRIPQVISALPGFYSIHKLGLGRIVGNIKSIKGKLTKHEL